MNKEDQNDQLVDMLLRELVGEETPPNVREQVMKSLELDQEAPKLVVSSQPVQQATLRRRKASKTPLFALAALVMLSGVFLGLIHVEGIKDARSVSLTEIHGIVSLPLGALEPGETLTTAADSTAVLTFEDGTVVALEPRTTVKIPSQEILDRAKTIELVLGGVIAQVMPQRKDFPLTLSAGHARAVVVGTDLAFYASKGHTRLEVTKGLVRLEPTNGADPVDVSAGQFAEADDTLEVRSGLIDPPKLAQLPEPQKMVEPAEPKKQSEIAKPATQSSPVPAEVTGFVLMNADSDMPVSEEPIRDGERISLSSLPSPRISFRAEIEGDGPLGVLFTVDRIGGGGTGLRHLPMQHHAPYFATGDFSGEKRSEDCRPWTPKPGRYRITATPVYRTANGKVNGETYELEVKFKR